MIKIRDLQFPSYFLSHEVQLRPELVQSLLEVEVVISDMGEPDSVQIKKNKIIVSQPSSITRFLFSVLYNLLNSEAEDPIREDKLSLGLLYACKDYALSDFENQLSSQCYSYFKGHPSALISLDKMPLVSVLLHEIVEPLVGNAITPSILFSHSPFIDAARIIETEDQFSKELNIPHRSIPFHDYPFIVVNESIQNRPAQTAHLLHKVLELSYGRDKANQIVKNILLDHDSDIFQMIVSIVKILHGEPGFILDFLKFFESNVILSKEEEEKIAESRIKSITSDKYLREHIKIGQQANYTPQVFKQWHQWSMIMGLIEKQLAPMRGSMWPTTELLKPVEDLQRQMIADRAKKKGKNQLNFEELLEVARETYGHKAYQPGQLYEKLLREHRIWKT